MTFKKRLKFYCVALTHAALLLTIRLIVTALDAVYRIGMWLGPHIKRGVAKLINFKRKVSRPDEQSTTTTNS